MLTRPRLAERRLETPVLRSTQLKYGRIVFPRCRSTEFVQFFDTARTIIQNEMVGQKVALKSVWAKVIARSYLSRSQKRRPKVIEIGTEEFCSKSARKKMVRSFCTGDQRAWKNQRDWER